MKINIGFNISQKAKRRNKGSSQLQFVDDYTVIDVETTDFDYFYGEIIELSAKNTEITLR